MNAQLVLENVAIRLPNRILFEDINWTLYEGMRVALVGRNGSGKSTLLKIMAGQVETSSGKCNVVGGRRLRVGFLDQSLLDKAVLESSQLKDKSLSSVQHIESRLRITKADADLGEIEWETRKVLGGLGFSREGMDMPMHQLSGGWLLRVFIGAALLDKPEVLLLDEPTNHLDLSSIQWLEEFLSKEYEGSIVLVTHDIALQKRTTDSLAILHGGRFYFRSNFHDYLSFRESVTEEKRVLEKNMDALTKKINENMEFVKKFRAKAKIAARAQSKLKTAQEMEEELKNLKDRLARLEGQSYNLKFQFRHSGTGGKFPLSLKDLSFRYNENSPWILQHVGLDIKRGQRVAILGDNGAGKTTLLNLLAERLTPTDGAIERGYAIETGYFGQHQLDELSLDNTLLENVRVRAIGVSVEEIRGWLGAFGFPGNDEIQKKAGVLSGGERARLALLRILVTRINLCLLDEPTNHLDIETKELLKNAIKAFEGTVVFVSHDREFVGEIADRVLYLTTDHQLTDHLGNLESFFEKYSQFVRHIEARSKPSQQAIAPKPNVTASSQLSYKERKRQTNLLKSQEKRIAGLEAEIDQLGREKETLSHKIADAGFYSITEGEQKAIFDQMSKIESRLYEKMLEWEKLSIEHEQLLKRL